MTFSSTLLHKVTALACFQLAQVACTPVAVNLASTHIRGGGVQAVNHSAALANENVTVNIPRENPGEWPPCLPYKPKPSNRGKDWWILNKAFKSNDA